MSSNSPSSSDALQQLEAAGVLWQYIQIGYLPDIHACLDALQPLLSDDKAATSDAWLAEWRRVRREVREEKQARSQGEPRTTHVSEVSRSVAAIGTSLPATPLLSLAAVARDARLFSTRGGVRTTEQFVNVALDSAGRIAFRFLVYPTAVGALSARLMSRALSISLERAELEICLDLAGGPRSRTFPVLRGLRDFIRRVLGVAQTCAWSPRRTRRGKSRSPVRDRTSPGPCWRRL
jgi:hypothetical protein